MMTMMVMILFGELWFIEYRNKCSFISQCAKMDLTGELCIEPLLELASISPDTITGLGYERGKRGKRPWASTRT